MASPTTIAELLIEVTSDTKNAVEAQKRINDVIDEAIRQQEELAQMEAKVAAARKATERVIQEQKEAIREHNRLLTEQTNIMAQRNARMIQAAAAHRDMRRAQKALALQTQQITGSLRTQTNELTGLTEALRMWNQEAAKAGQRNPMLRRGFSSGRLQNAGRTAGVIGGLIAGANRIALGSVDEEGGFLGSMMRETGTTLGLIPEDRGAGGAVANLELRLAERARREELGPEGIRDEQRATLARQLAEGDLGIGSRLAQDQMRDLFGGRRIRDVIGTVYGDQIRAGLSAGAGRAAAGTRAFGGRLGEMLSSREGLGQIRDSNLFQRLSGMGPLGAARGLMQLGGMGLQGAAGAVAMSTPMDRSPTTGIRAGTQAALRAEREHMRGGDTVKTAEEQRERMATTLENIGTQLSELLQVGNG